MLAFGAVRRTPGEAGRALAVTGPCLGPCRGPSQPRDLKAGWRKARR